MLEILIKIWMFEYALVPCFTAYLVFDFTAVIRRLTRKAYVPIYFLFFPFGYTDELYAQYFDEDELQILGPPLTIEQKVEVRKKIIWLSVLSIIFAVIVSPALAGLFCYFFLTEDQFVQFIITLLLVKSVLLSKSLYDLKYVWAIMDKISLWPIAFIYLLYILAIWINTETAYEWAAQQYPIGGMVGLMRSMAQLVVQEYGITFCLSAILGWLIPWRLLSGESSSGV